MDLSENERTCSICGLPFEDFPDTEDSEMIEIDVRAHRRIVQSKKYIPACRCCPRPGIICAPAAARVVPKGIFGVSVWVTVLLEVGRKNYYGSGSEWSGRLAAVLFSIFQTLGLFNLNPRRWLQMYLQACSENAGKAYEDIETFLPYNMTSQRLAELSFEPVQRDSS